VSHDDFGRIAMGIEERNAVAGENIIDRPADHRCRFADAGFADHPGMGKTPVVENRNVDVLFGFGVKAPG